MPLSIFKTQMLLLPLLRVHPEEEEGEGVRGNEKTSTSGKWTQQGGSNEENHPVTLTTFCIWLWKSFNLNAT